MYVCHCNRIPERDIRTAIDSLAERNPKQPATPADVLLILNRFGKCLGCFPLIESMLAGTEGNIPLAPVPEAPTRDAAPSEPRKRRRGGAFARRTAT